MVKRFMTVTENIDFIRPCERDRKISPYEALTVASLAQAEAGNAADLGKISRVAYNRLYSHNFPATACSSTSGSTTTTSSPAADEVVETDDQRRADRPEEPVPDARQAGPHADPDQQSGRGGAAGRDEPAAGPWLYFVAIDKQGHSAFATTLSSRTRTSRSPRRTVSCDRPPRALPAI
jgi:UPF0755 protein